MEKVEASIRAVELIYPITSYSGVINLLVLNSDIDLKQIKVHLTNSKNETGYLSPRRSRWRTSCDSLWELFCIEHGLRLDGKFTEDKNLHKSYFDTFKSFFREFSDSSYVPRSLFIDLEPAAINEVKTGSNRQLYEPTQFISGKEDAGCTYARGRCTVGKALNNG